MFSTAYDFDFLYYAFVFYLEIEETYRQTFSSPPSRIEW